MKKTILFSSLILIGGLFAASKIDTTQIQERLNMRGNRQGQKGFGQGLRNGSGQRKMDGTGPRSQRGECLRVSNSTTDNNRLHRGQGLRDGSGQRQMNGTGPRAQKGECLRNEISENRQYLAQGPRDGSGPRGQKGECLKR